jgi:uncharacterized protein YegP (UPF0339 family)
MFCVPEMFAPWRTAMPKFELYKDKKGEFRFRFLASNGEPLFASEGYKARASATKAIESIKKNAADAAVEDRTKDDPAAKAKPAKAPAKASAKSAAKAAAPKADKPAKAAAAKPAKATKAAKAPKAEKAPAA